MTHALTDLVDDLKGLEELIVKERLIKTGISFLIHYAALRVTLFNTLITNERYLRFPREHLGYTWVQIVLGPKEALTQETQLQKLVSLIS